MSRFGLLRRGLVVASSGFVAGVSFALAAETTSVGEGKTSFNRINEWRKQVFGNYENRIREMSSPEKVFAYFASRTIGDEKFMTPQDFVRCILPYSFSDTKQDFPLPASFQRVMKVADPNGDGLISFEEYVFFTSLLSIPQKYFDLAFKLMDVDRNGKVDAEEFRTAMAVIQSHNPISQATRTKLDKMANSVLLPGWFGEKGDATLTYQQFRSFLVDLHNAVRETYFASIDTDNDGFISARDFAMSLVNFAAVKHLPRFVERADRLPEKLRSIRVDRLSFVEWQSVLSNLADIDRALTMFVAGPGNDFTVEQLRRAVHCVTGIKLKEEQLNVVLAVFDDDGNGKLSRSEFQDVLSRAASFGLSKPRDFGLIRFIDCCKDCVGAKN